MAGPNLEVFKFAVYVFFPVALFWHFGDPEWYDRNVLPVRPQLSPTMSCTHSVHTVQRQVVSRREARYPEFSEGQGGRAGDSAD